MDVFITILGDRDDRPIEVRPRRSIEEEPTVAVPLGRAPDGLPLVLQIQRRISLLPDLLQKFGASSAKELPGDIRKAVENLERVLSEHARMAGVVPHPTPRAQGGTYVTSHTIRDLVGLSIPARALGPQSPLVLPEDVRRGDAEPERMADTRTFADAKDSQEAQTVLKRMTAPRRLGVGCRDGQPWVTDWDGKPEKPPQWVRAFLFESVTQLREACWRVRRDGAESGGRFGDRRSYARAVREADAIGWSLPRSVVGEIIAQAADSVEDRHRKGVVHGDLKPQNILVLEEGAWPFDSLEIRAGGRSPAATPGWAAPEQVLAREATPATDVFSLGLMAASLAGAVIHGEERSFLVPSGGRDRMRLRLLVSSDVFLDTTTQEIVPARGAAAWRELLAKALAFEPGRRPASAGEFARALRQVLEDHPPEGSLAVRAGPGSLMRNVVIDGEVQPAWVLTDGW